MSPLCVPVDAEISVHNMVNDAPDNSSLAVNENVICQASQIVHQVIVLVPLSMAVENHVILGF